MGYDFHFCTLRERRKAGVSIHPAAFLTLFHFSKGCFSDDKTLSSEAALSWTRAIFSHKSLPINIKSWRGRGVGVVEGEGHLGFHYCLRIKEHRHKHMGATLLKGHLCKMTSWWKLNSGQKKNLTKINKSQTT